jgi:ubiquinone/menaquinone biosynthesis C-methylase UbiE
MSFKGKTKYSKLHSSAEGYDLYASCYDQDLGYLDSFERTVLLQMFADLKGKQVLDVGCGTGRLVRDLRNSGAFVTGVDISEKMVEACKKKFPGMGVKLGEADELPFEDESFDVLVASFLIVHLKTLDKFFDEAMRVLKPGGTLFVTNINQRKAPKLKTKDNEEIVILSFYHRPDDVKAALEHAFFDIEKEEFVRDGKVWVNQIIKATKR